MELKVPNLRSLPFVAAIIEWYRRRESSVEEALVGMDFGGVPIRRDEEIIYMPWREDHIL